MKSIRKFFQKIVKERFRITFFHDDFKPVFSLRFTVFTFILSVIGFATVIIFITTLVIAKTSLKEYIPGYGTAEEKKQIISIIRQLDSLQESIAVRNVYLQSALKALKGESDSTPIQKQTKPLVEKNIRLKASEKEVKIRQELYNVSLNNRVWSANEDVSQISFFPPAKGIVVTQFDAYKNHLGIDIAGKSEEPVRSIYKGIVLYAGYSVSDGNFIIIAHPNGFTSVYKHLSLILKNTGNYVSSNELIGTMGNTGSESNGVHLHFELWYQDTPKNPMDYLSM